MLSTLRYGRVLKRTHYRVQRISNARLATTSSNPGGFNFDAFVGSLGNDSEDTNVDGSDAHFDVAIIGGGSGGMAASFEASRLGLKTILFDHVDATPSGNTWDVGGTCVNVGCVPKKLFHSAALQMEGLRHAEAMGWTTPPSSSEPTTANWEALVEGTKKQIHALNFSYRSALTEAGVKLVTEHARIDGADIGNADTPYSIAYASTDVLSGTQVGEQRVTADHVIVATGGRPRFPTEISGFEHMIGSDDIFTLPQAPGRTLCIGAGYISLECAGFLSGLGFEVDG